MITNKIKLTEVYTTSYMCTCICTVDSMNTIVIAREEYFKFYDKLIPLDDKQYGPSAVHVTTGTQSTRKRWLSKILYVKIMYSI